MLPNYGMMRVPSSMSTIFLLIFFPSFSLVSAGVQYKLVDQVIGTDFYDFFTWEAIPDPTHGRVQYVDEKTSRDLNLTFASKNAFILRADNKEILNPAGPGRKSVRIQSKKQYKKHVAIFDVRHMPEGCGTWPAIWEVTNSGWPVGGEVDIVEGANDQSPNAATLHTAEGCSMPGTRQHKGITGSLNCASSGTNNQGCGVRFPSKNSFGPNFNKGGGGWYALERSADFINIWFWSRGDKKVPVSVKIGADSVNPSSEWGSPSASFPNTPSCKFNSHFDAHRIIINLTLCGDWAGATYSQSGCPGSCVDHVNNNPKAFSNAVFNIASIHVYL